MLRLSQPWYCDKASIIYWEKKVNGVMDLHARRECRLNVRLGTLEEHLLNDGSSRICRSLRLQLPKGLAICI